MNGVRRPPLHIETPPHSTLVTVEVKNLTLGKFEPASILCFGKLTQGQVHDLKTGKKERKLEEKLYMNDKHKKMVGSLVTQFVRASELHTKPGCADVIEGKAESLIFLLYGPPGTGKTMTAEWIAEKTRMCHMISGSKIAHTCQDAPCFPSLPLNLVSLQG